MVIEKKKYKENLYIILGSTGLSSVGRAFDCSLFTISNRYQNVAGSIPAGQK